ncbi:MAG: molybdopterin-dependent oxidoreductase [Rhodospirillales bacterium]|nr:molybdopterin-dependent oxidoreductase [Rhodospirillales bacterium]
MNSDTEVSPGDSSATGGVASAFKVVCRMCHGGCGTIVEMVGGTVSRVFGDKENPINRGALCSKAGVPSIEQLYHPDRLDYPLMRTGERGAGKWRRASWDEALDFIAEKMLAIRDQHGAEGVAFGRGTGVNNTHIVSRLANLFGTPNVTAIAYFCYGPRVAVAKVTASGNYSQRGWDTTPISDVYGKPRCVVQWGSQKRTSNDHGLIGHIPVTDALRENPVNIVVDPRKPNAAGPADIWLPLRPGTDAAMALGWMRVIIDEGLYDKEFVERYCHGFDELAERVKDYPLDKVAEITWCQPEEIARAARTYATTAPGCIIWGNGTDQLGNNTFQATRALLILMGITGNLDVPGGNVFYPAPKLEYPELWDKLSPEQEAKRIGGDRFKALNLTPYAYAHPPSLYHTMITDKPYPVKAYIVTGNNTVTCFPNTGRIIEAMKKLDLLVVMDMFMTPTAELADVVLPAAGNLERDEPRLHLHTKGPQATFMDTVSQKLVEIGERRSDWEFIIGLGRKLGYGEHFPSLEEFAEKSLKPMGTTWDKLKKMDHGIELPVQYRKYEKEGFGTPTGKFEIYSTIMEEWGYDPLPAHVEPAEGPVSTPERFEEYPLILNTGAKQPMFWHSQGRQLKSLRKLNAEPLVEINAKTAEAYGIKKGDYVWIETVRGRLRMRAHLHDQIHEKVVSIPHGWWLPEEPGPDRGVFEVCSNVLVDDDPDNCDVVLGSSPLKGLLCRISKAEAPARTISQRWKEAMAAE